MMSRMSSRPPILAMLALYLSTFLGISRGAGAADASPDLRDLDSVEQFRGLYNAKAGVPRLVLLLSPT